MQEARAQPFTPKQHSLQVYASLGGGSPMLHPWQQPFTSGPKWILTTAYLLGQKHERTGFLLQQKQITARTTWVGDGEARGPKCKGRFGAKKEYNKK